MCIRGSEHFDAEASVNRFRTFSIVDFICDLWNIDENCRDREHSDVTDVSISTPYHTMNKMLSVPL